MTEEQALKKLRRMGFKIFKIKKGVQYIEILGKNQNLDSNILQWTPKQLIGIADSYNKN